MAQKLPASTCLEGLDVSVDQVPPTGWLPHNVSFRKFDIFDDVPEDLVEKYDIVHVRHLILVVKDNNPLPVLRQLLKLLKVGGYIQWGEVDLSNRKTVKTHSDNSSESLKQLQDDVQELLHTPFSSWPANLGEIFRSQGMTDVLTDSKWTRQPYLFYGQANNLLIQEEITNRVAGEKKEHLRKLFAKAVAECRQGVAWNIERLTTIGQKVRTSQ
ncbi:MAG: hypothetical protein M1827_004628 [Pycnora praestabilis]|nr:MAG: hypothetical protein M1827_004628 [Pycnora praestabilis]